MVKVKKSNSNEQHSDIFSETFLSKYGKIIENGEKVLNDLMELKVVSLSPALDLALGGGIREGSMVVMTGDPKTGKTTTALYFAAKCQALGKNVLYFNTEGRITKENFTGIKGLDPSKITIVQSTDDQPLVSAEMYLNSLEHCIKNIPELVCIIDSASNMVPQEELDGEIRTGVRNALPRLLSMFCKRISGDVHRNKAILIFITHNITNTAPASKYSPSKVADCGVMVQYQAGTNMVITHRGKWEVPADSGNHVGQIANWTIKTSASGGKPNSTAESWIRYGLGIDEIQEIAQLATQFSLIKKKGAWYEISQFIDNKNVEPIREFLTKKKIDLENEEAVAKCFKFQGMENMTNFLKENEDLANFLYNVIKEVLL
jgi:recombination protein RecA